MRRANVWESQKQERSNQKWVLSKLAKLPRLWGESVLRQYDALRKQDFGKANLYLRELVEPLEGSIDISLDDGDLQNLANTCANQCRNHFQNYVYLQKGFDDYYEFWAWDECLKLANEYAVRYPFEYDMNQQKARLTDETWWLRNLRNSHAKARESAAREAGIVHKKHNVYVSDDTLERRKQQSRRNAELLKAVQMVNEHGEVMKLSDIANAGMANQENRRNELMTRIAGFEELAVKHNHKAMFLTITAPSRMHKMLASGKANPKYDGTNPSEAQQYLRTVWAQTRAILAKHEIRFYGLRVAEPHHDGTPHWHMIVFYDGKQSTAKKLQWHITQKFIAAEREELGRDVSPRVKIVHINPAKGSAAGYVAKYVAKNIGGIEGETSDEANASSESLAERVEAWASTWRIRQFQQIGGHSVSVWRELRRVDEAQCEGKRPAFVNLWQACQRNGEVKANWAKFIECMGGLETKPRESLYKVDHDVITIAGRYGEALAFKPLGVGERFGREVMANNRLNWQRF